MDSNSLAIEVVSICDIKCLELVQLMCIPFRKVLVKYENVDHGGCSRCVYAILQ